MATVTAVPLSGIDKLGFDASEVTVEVPANVPAEVGANVTVNVALWPGVKVTGRVIPEMLNPVPDADTVEIVVLAPPVLVRVSFRPEVFPTVSVKLMLASVGVTTAAAVAVPVPDRAMSAVLLDPEKPREIRPVTAPAVVGANFTPKVVVWPEVKVSGTLSPVMLKPVPVTLACEMVTLEPPVFCRVSVWVALLPSATEPKLKLDGLVPNPPPRTPAPVSGTMSCAVVPVLAMFRLAAMLPTVCGWKTMLKLVDWPAARVIGKLNPVRVKLPLSTLAAVISRLVPPVLVSVFDSVWLVPTPTLPKATLAGDALS